MNENADVNGLGQKFILLSVLSLPVFWAFRKYNTSLFNCYGLHILQASRFFFASDNDTA